MNQSQNGTIYLVGSGPGDPDLLTVKAKKLLMECEALIYDSLVPKELLELVPATCKSYFVGKKRGKHSVPQGHTNELLVLMAHRHSCVVRLKGGDPFLFGRGAEEASYLIEQGIKVEVVPGVTAGIAVPAYFGIPVTHRLGGSSVTFVTGHEGINKKAPSVNWKMMAKATDGIVIYMGIHNLAFITQELIDGGLAPETPSVAIQQGTVIGQKFIKSHLKFIAHEVSEKGFIAPSIIMIGSAINYQVPECAPLPANVIMPIPF